MIYDNNLQISSRSVERLRRYCKFSIFNMAAARHLEFVKYANFNITHGLQPKSAYLYKISSQSVERLWRYRDFLISNMAAVRHFEFSKYANFHVLRGLQWYLHVPAKFCLYRSNGCGYIAIVCFQICWPSAILNF